jgi:hypothetical protein
MYRTWLTWELGFALLAAGGLNCMAAEPPAPPLPAGASLDAMTAATAGDDSAAKRQILESPAWQQAVQGFKEWLSVQVVYDKEEVPQLEKQFTDKVNKMSASQLQGFLADLQQKLKIMSSPQAMEARAWAEDFLTKYTPAAAEKFRRTLPDVANMNAAQLQQALYQVQQRQNAEAANQRAFDQIRNQEVAAARQRNLMSAEADAEANAQSPSFGDYYSGSYGGTTAGIYAPLKYSSYVPRYPGYLGGWRW